MRPHLNTYRVKPTDIFLAPNQPNYQYDFTEQTDIEEYSETSYKQNNTQILPSTYPDPWRVQETEENESNNQTEVIQTIEQLEERENNEAN